MWREIKNHILENLFKPAQPLARLAAVLKIKSKMTQSLLLIALPLLFTPALSQAEPYDTGDIASMRAAEQKAALAKKAEKRKKEAEAKKAATAQQANSVPAQPPAENTPEKPAPQ